LKDLAVAI